MKIKLKFGKKNSLMGDKFIGFVWSETYDAYVCGFMFWNKGLFLVIPYNRKEK